MKYNRLLKLTLLAVTVMAAACTFEEAVTGKDIQADLPSESLAEGIYTYKLHLDMPNPDGTATRAAGTWANGSEVEFFFYTEATQAGYKGIPGTATYNASEQAWTLTTNAKLPTTPASTDCEARYYKPGSDPSNEFLTAVYYATGSYVCQGDTDVYADVTLKSCNWRLRFKGTAGTQLTFTATNIRHCTGDSLHATVDKQADAASIPLTVGNDGYTSYIYGAFIDNNSSSTFTVATGEKQFSRTFASADLKVGEGRVLDVPTHEGKGWISDVLPFTITGNGKTVTFKMILVEGGTFQMGATAEQGSDANSDEKTAHSVTLTMDYYMGETEVTQALWYAVMGQKPTSGGSRWSSTYGLGDNRPAYYVSWNDCQEFITKLNQITGQQFRLPTEAEWEFAARGGTKSKGYKYSGSNTVGDVAWYYNNSSSKTHDVATKQANELGIYDMSGNVWEWCSDWYGSYTSDAQTNPTGSTLGSYRVGRGGSWNYIATFCRVANRYRNTPTNTYNDLGFRLAL